MQGIAWLHTTGPGAADCCGDCVAGVDLAVLVVDLVALLAAELCEERVWECEPLRDPPLLRRPPRACASLAAISPTSAARTSRLRISTSLVADGQRSAMVPGCNWARNDEGPAERSAGPSGGVLQGDASSLQRFGRLLLLLG